MRFDRAVPAAVAVIVTGCVLVLAACGGDSSGPAAEDVIPEALVGSWVAEPACVNAGCGFILSPESNPADTLNATAAFGITTEITLTRRGGFTLSILPGNTLPVIGTARLGGEANTLIVTSANGAVDTLDYAVGGNVLDFKIRRAYTFPYVTVDGVPVPAKASGRFHRRN